MYKCNVVPKICANDWVQREKMWLFGTTKKHVSRSCCIPLSWRQHKTSPPCNRSKKPQQKSRCKACNGLWFLLKLLQKLLHFPHTGWGFCVVALTTKQLRQRCARSAQTRCPCRSGLPCFPQNWQRAVWERRSKLCRQIHHHAHGMRKLGKWTWQRQWHRQ